MGNVNSIVTSLLVVSLNVILAFPMRDSSQRPRDDLTKANRKSRFDNGTHRSGDKEASDEDIYADWKVKMKLKIIY